ncbi:MAG TPA: hypothetical protein VFP95_02490 [Gammaproteobacteria bacterium]|nr:hypothetical protein [Gammaproteobacteria bacterium]
MLEYVPMTNMNNKPDSLEAWGVIRVSGADTDEFLQGQLSNDIRALTSGQPQLSSYNSPKGRVLAVIYVYRVDNAIYLRLPHLLIQPVMQRLKMFVMRSKVTLDDVSDELATRGLDGLSRQQRILAGIPTVYPETQDKFVAQMLNLDTLEAINFKKGCYTGQEIIARMHYLGKLKRRMYPVTANNPNFAPGQPVYAENAKQPVGSMVDGVGNEGLAVLQTDKINESLHLDSPDGIRINVK